MRAVVAFLALLILAGCGGGGGSKGSPDTSNLSWNLTVRGADWDTFNSDNVSKHPADPWTITMAANSEVDFVTTDARGPLTGAKSLTLEFDVAGNWYSVETPDCPDRVPQLRLYFQRRGDDLSAVGKYEDYRWYTAQVAAAQPMTPGHHAVTVSLIDLSQWKSVYTHNASAYPQQFAAALADPDKVGFGLGKCSAGHGLRASAGSTLKLIKAMINR